MTELPAHIEKQIARKCLYSGCDDDALEDSDLCGPHEAHERGRDAAKKRRRRQGFAKAGLCITGCGRKVSRKMRRGRRGRGAKVRMLRCSVCTKAHREQMEERRSKERGVPGASGDVPGDVADPRFRVVADLRPERAGQTTLRYIGKGRRGRLTREEQAEEDKRDAAFAVEEIRKFIKAVDVVMSDEVQAMPKIQREEARRQAAQHLGTASRFLDDLAERYGTELR